MPVSLAHTARYDAARREAVEARTVRRRSCVPSRPTEPGAGERASRLEPRLRPAPARGLGPSSPSVPDLGAARGGVSGPAEMQVEGAPGRLLGVALRHATDLDLRPSRHAHLSNGTRSPASAGARAGRAVVRTPLVARSAGLGRDAIAFTAAAPLVTDGAIESQILDDVLLLLRVRLAAGKCNLGPGDGGRAALARHGHGDPGRSPVAVDEFTGSASLDVPVPLTAARALTPQLVLRWGGGGNSVVGRGWSLADLPAITIDTSEHLPRWDGSDGFALGGACRLVVWRADDGTPRRRIDGDYRGHPDLRPRGGFTRVCVRPRCISPRARFIPQPRRSRHADRVRRPRRAARRRSPIPTPPGASPRGCRR